MSRAMKKKIVFLPYDMDTAIGIEPGAYTIVDEQDGWGLLKAYAEKRNGWIKLSYTSKV